jgi:uncharacterized protein YggE
MIEAIQAKAIVVGLLTLSMLGLPLAACAGPVQHDAKINVTGEGRVSAAPDMALLSLTVTRDAETARAALDANNQAMSDVLKAMRDAGIANKDLQTSGFSIQPKYVYPQLKSTGERQPPKIVGYTVRNSLDVRVTDISRVGQILDISVTMGVNEGGNIQLSNARPEALLEKAREAAVKDAIAKATTLAKSAGVRLGQILEIAERPQPSGPVPMARAEMAMMRTADAPVPVAGGENTYRVNVDMTFIIEQ